MLVMPLVWNKDDRDEVAPLLIGCFHVSLTNAIEGLLCPGSRRLRDFMPLLRSVMQSSNISGCLESSAVKATMRRKEF